MAPPRKGGGVYEERPFWTLIPIQFQNQFQNPMESGTENRFEPIGVERERGQIGNEPERRKRLSERIVLVNHAIGSWSSALITLSSPFLGQVLLEGRECLG